MERLLGPNGCPWDREQTLFDLQKYLLEEVHELIEAIDGEDPKNIAEELGDVFFSLVFIGKLGEKENLFTTADALRLICEKLIRRHPHIFANEKIQSTEDIVKNWEAIKKKEKERKSILDGIPASLPALTRAQKIIEKLHRAESPLEPVSDKKKWNDVEVGKKLWEIVAAAQFSKIDAEGALRRYSSTIERQEKNTGD